MTITLISGQVRLPDCIINSAIANINYVTANARAPPSQLTGRCNRGLVGECVSIVGTPTVFGTFNYTVPDRGCGTEQLPEP